MTVELATLGVIILLACLAIISYALSVVLEWRHETFAFCCSVGAWIFGGFAVLIGLILIFGYKSPEEKAQIERERTPTFYKPAPNGCEIYRFRGESDRWSYYTQCPNSTVTTENHYSEKCGRNTCERQESIVTYEKRK